MIPANIYLLEVNNRNARKKVWNMFKVNSDFIVSDVLMFLLLTLNILHTFF